MRVALQKKGLLCNHKKIRRLMRLAGLKTVYPKKKTSAANALHKKYPYLLREMDIANANKVWAIDITYIKLKHGFGYLACIIDIYSRRIMGWDFSPFLETASSLKALDRALKNGTPEIVNSDQGCQFTSHMWVNALLEKGIKISMDGKGRWADNIYIERFWRTLKYEQIFLNSLENLDQAREKISEFIDHYNQERPHQSLKYETPDQIYFLSNYKAHNTNNRDLNVKIGSFASLDQHSLIHSNFLC